MTTTTETVAEYRPEQVLNALMGRLGVKNDAALARALEVAAPVISKVRNRRTPLGDNLLLRAHEVSGLSIRELKSLMGERPPFESFRPKA